MAPDIEELIKKVNILTLDKNRLRQKLAQVISQNGSQSYSKEASVSSNNSPPDLSASLGNNQLYHQGSSDSCDPKNLSIINKTPPNESPMKTNNSMDNVIAGVECSSSCEEDLLFMNNLYKERLDEYNENWEYIQSKCTALLSELNALQKQYSILKLEKLDLEDKYKSRCDECDNIKSELQTVVLNYETQLSAMSDHLSMITSQVNLGDNLAGSYRVSEGSDNFSNLTIEPRSMERLSLGAITGRGRTKRA